MKSATLISLAACASAAAGYKLTNYYTEDELINRINSANDATWTAGKNSVFEDMSMDEIRAMMGTVVSEDPPLDNAFANDQDYSDIINNLPAEFDAREKWGSCIHPIRQQAKCGSCWSFAGSEALSDRFCIKGHDVILSPQYLVSCDKSDMGCGGGRLSSAWNYMHSHGISTDECEPYMSGNGTAPKCSHVCADGQKPVLYRARNAYSVVNFFDLGDMAVRKIKAEIMKNGPVEAGYNVFQDFLQYKSGVYRYREGNLVGGHAVKIVGWGEDSVGGPFWWIANSWGADWGINGFFKMALGVNECGIEREVWAGVPDIDHTYPDNEEGEE